MRGPAEDAPRPDSRLRPRRRRRAGHRRDHAADLRPRADGVGVRHLRDLHRRHRHGHRASSTRAWAPRPSGRSTTTATSSSPTRRSVITTAFVTSTAISTVVAAAIVRRPRAARATGSIDGEPDATVVAIAAVTLPLLAVGQHDARGPAPDPAALALHRRRRMIATLVGSGARHRGRDRARRRRPGDPAAASASAGGARRRLRHRQSRARTCTGTSTVTGCATMLRFGLPLLPGPRGAVVDRVRRPAAAGPASRTSTRSGLYAIGARFAAPVLLLMAAFVTAYHPFLLSCASISRRWSASCAVASPRCWPSACWAPGCR